MSEQPLLDAANVGAISLSSEVHFTANGIVSRTLMKTPTLRMVLFGFDAGQELTEHTSPYHAVIQVLSGECRFSVNGIPHELKTGSLLTMPTGAPHSVIAITQFSMLLTLSKVM